MTPASLAPYLSRIVRLDPLRHLPTDAVQALLEHCQLLHCGAGQTLAAGRSRDDRLYYLLAGNALLMLADARVRTLRAEQEQTLRPLDGPGLRGASLRALSDCTVLAVPPAELDALAGAAERHRPAGGPRDAGRIAPAGGETGPGAPLPAPPTNVVSFVPTTRRSSARAQDRPPASEVQPMEPTRPTSSSDALDARPPGAGETPAESLDHARAIPRELLDNTVTGHTLATLIDEIDAQRRSIDRDPPAADTATEAGEQDPLERTQEVRQVVEAALGPESAGEETPARDDELARLVQVFEARLRAHVEKQVRTRIDAEIGARTARIKEAAVREIRRQTAAIKQRYQNASQEHERQLATRERELQSGYERLMDIANRIGRQKAQINDQRRLLAEKLAAADNLHRQVSDIATTVGRQMDDLEDLIAEAS